MSSFLFGYFKYSFIYYKAKLQLSVMLLYTNYEAHKL